MANNLGKRFVNSTVNQVGRDFGKTISNKVFGDKHSTPVRRVGGTSSTPKRSIARIKVLPKGGDIDETKRIIYEIAHKGEPIQEEAIPKNATVMTDDIFGYVSLFILVIGFILGAIIF